MQEEYAGVVARVEALRGRMGESARQVESLFQGLVSEEFNGNLLAKARNTIYYSILQEV